MVFHAEGHETGLNLLVTEIHWPPNNVTLPHIHELEDESFSSSRERSRSGSVRPIRSARSSS